MLCLLRRAWFLSLGAGPGAQVGLTAWGRGGRGVAYVKRLSESGLVWKVEKHPFLLRVIYFSSWSPEELNACFPTCCTKPIKS